jgi:hypothetical protein
MAKKDITGILKPTYLEDYLHNVLLWVLILCFKGFFLSIIDFHLSSYSFLSHNEKLWEEIQDGDWDTAADCMSSVNQEACWDTGDTLGRGKAQGRAKTSALWIPRSWKASPCHNLLKDQLAAAWQAPAP